MALVFVEIVDTRGIDISKDGINTNRQYKVFSDVEADESLMLDPELVIPEVDPIGTAHPTIAGIILKDIKISSNTQTTNRCFVNYIYARPDRGSGGGRGQSTPDANAEQWTFSMVSQSVTINMAKSDANGNPQQVTYDKDNIRGKQLYAAINFDDDTVNGVEVYRPTETVSVTKVYEDYTDVNQSYRNTIRELLNTVNDSTWPSGSEFAAGELLFLGADISYNLVEGSATVNYTFQAGAIRKKERFEVWKRGATVGDETETITIEKLYPFQKVWAPLERKKSRGTSGTWNTHLKSVNVADVYEYGDFTGLKITGN
jgi:hypothetical protein